LGPQPAQRIVYFQSNGQFTFGGSSGLGSTGDGLADFMLGAVNQFSQGNNEQRELETKLLGVYGQDNYRVRPNLTLNFGLRWEPYSPAADRYKRAAILTRRHLQPAP